MSRNATIHTTDRLQFKKCRLQWHFTSPLRLNLEPVRGKPALTFGTAIHRGLEVYYDPATPRSPSEGIKAFDENLTAWVDSLPNPQPEDVAQYEDLIALGYGMLEHYFGWANKHDDFEVLAVEKHIEFDVPGIDPKDYGLERVVYSFKMDALVKDKDGRIWIMEDKTAQSLPDNTDYLLMDDQVGSYLWGLQVAEGIKAEGVLYNILRKKSPVPLKRNKNGLFSVDKRQDTTYDIALAALLKEYGEIPDYAQEFMEYLKFKGENFFHRELVRRNAQEISALGESVKMEVSDMLSDPSIYRTPTQFNCGGCSFVTPCMAYYEGADVEAILNGGNYKERKVD